MHPFIQVTHRRIIFAEAVFILICSSFTFANPMPAGAAITPYLKLNNDQMVGSISFPEVLGLGWEFALSQATEADYLGIYDDQGDGVSMGLNLYLWEANDPYHPIAQALNVDGQGGTYQDGFRWYGIAPQILPPGQYVVSAPRIDFWAEAGTFTTLPQVTWMNGRLADLNQSPIPLPYPMVVTPGKGIWGANVAFHASSPPVPAHAPLVGIGVALGCSRKLRKRINDNKAAKESGIG